jgi:hypothetical protein
MSRTGPVTEAQAIARRAALLYTDAVDLAGELDGVTPEAMTVTLLATAMGIAMAENLKGLDGTGAVEASLQVVAKLVVRATVYQMALRRGLKA